MTLVYAKISLRLIEITPKFFTKLKEYVGEFRVEGQDVYDIQREVIKISFHTDKVQFKEGEDRCVYLEGTYKDDSLNWEFTNIEKA